MGGKDCVILKRKHQVHSPLLAELPFLEGRLLEQGLRETQACSTGLGVHRETMNNKHKSKFVAFEYTSIVTVATTILRKNKIQLTLACKVAGTGNRHQSV